ncbi:ricin-type beta-trefoil lectin domain protein [Streptomyces sp. NPDC088354]|uniref:ricin-type beta-trefoil lectin domain protein n=1 Tax=Streptomyces sp. NPDC088354 TaxID=3365856 RepID=UPI00381F5392
MWQGRFNADQHNAGRLGATRRATARGAMPFHNGYSVMENVLTNSENMGLTPAEAGTGTAVNRSDSASIRGVRSNPVAPSRPVPSTQTASRRESEPETEAGAAVQVPSADAVANALSGRRAESELESGQGQDPVESAPGTDDPGREGAESKAAGQVEGNGTAAAEPDVVTDPSAGGGSGADVVETSKLGRPPKTVLAAAAIAGLVLVSVPFLINSSNSNATARGGDSGSTTGTVLGGSSDDAPPGAFASVAPIPGLPHSSSPDAFNRGSTSGDKGPAKSGVGSSGTSNADSSPSKGGGTKAQPQTSSGGGTKAQPQTSSGGGTKAQPQTSSGGGTKTSTGSASSGGSQPAPIAPGVLIRGHASGRCIDITGGKGYDGTPLNLYDCVGSNWQKWEIKSDGTIRSMGLCMDVAGGSRSNGAVIQVAKCNGSAAQQFRLNTAHDLTNPQSDKCVDVLDQKTGNGARLQLWTCNGQRNQKWSSA